MVWEGECSSNVQESVDVGHSSNDYYHYAVFADVPANSRRAAVL